MLLPGMLAAQGTASSDATLKELVLNDGSADVAINPSFDPAVTAYTAEVESGVRVVTVTATPADDQAAVNSDPEDDDADAEGIQVPLVLGANGIAIVVTAEDGSESTYNITVTRAAYCTANTFAVTAITRTPSDGLINDCNILLDAKEILESPNGLPLNWSTGRSMQSWTAIEVSGDRVTQLDSEMDDDQTIFSNSLQGEIPPELGNLSALTVLRFRNVSLRGEIPEQLGNLSELTTLDLSNNRNDLLAFGGGFEGSIPASLGNLQRLEVLGLSHNKLSGEIPLSIRRLTSLRVLDLGGNVDVDVFQRPTLPASGLEGIIPAALLAELRNLEELDLSFNRFTGGIPRELGELVELDALHLHRNFLTGCIPGNLQRFTDLGFLKGINPQRNTNNYLTRDLPACPVPNKPSVTLESSVGGEVVVSYRATVSDGEPVTGWEYRLSADGGTTWNPDWSTIPDSAPGGASANSYKLRGLIDGTEYTLELRAVNIDGAGPSASVTSAPKAHAAAALRDLVLSDGAADPTLSPAFLSTRYSYIVMVGDVETVTIVATPAQVDATVDSNPEDDDHSQDGIQVPLEPGFNIIELTVTAGDGSKQVYRVTVIRNPTDVPAGVNAEPTELSLDEGTTASYTLVLAAEPVETVTVVVKVDGSRSVKASPSHLTFTTSNWNSPQTVSVEAQTDADESNERALLAHVATGAGYDVVSIAAVSVTVTDDNDVWSPKEPDIQVYADRLVLVFDLQLDESSVPPTDDFQVNVGGERIDVTKVTVSGNSVTLTLARRLLVGEQAFLSYTLANIRSMPTVGDAVVPLARVLLFESASNPDRQGFVRIINHSDEAGEVRIEAVDDYGVRSDPVSLAVDAGTAAHFNADDLENGSPRKGLPDGVGSMGLGNWRLELASELDIEVLSYARTTDGFVTSLHDSVAVEPGVPGEAVFFNPGKNVDQVSRLRLVNPGTTDASVTIEGTDDGGEAAGEVRVVVRAGTSVDLTAGELESGIGLGIQNGALGDGNGKWRLRITSGAPIAAMSLLESQGRLTNLSTAPQTPGSAEGSLSVPLFPAASDPELAGFVRVINRSSEAGEVEIQAFDDTDRVYETVTLDVGAGETAPFNSEDVESGNPEKGLTGSTGGAGEGDWRLELSSELDIEVLAYIRTTDGFVTAMHDLAPIVDGVHRVVFLNPASNTEQVSRLRLVNPGEGDATVTITGIDSAGESPGDPVSATVAAGVSLTLTSADLESGASDGIDSGALGDGKGKWLLKIESDRAIHVMSLLKSPTGHLTNLSTSPDREAGG